MCPEILGRASAHASGLTEACARLKEVRETYKDLRLDRFQREAMEAIDRSENVIVAAPTGAGKTLIAEYVLEQVIKSGKRAIYTAPIKALSNQKYRDLVEQYPGKVGISTGDVSIDPNSPIVIMTTEIFRNTIFDDPERAADVAWVIFDEVHYLDDPDRGTVWEESLIFAPPSVRVLALSATVSNLEEFAEWVREVRNTPTTVVLETERPVPLTVFVRSTEGEVCPLAQVGSLRLNKNAFSRGMAARKRNVRRYYASANVKMVKEIAQRKQLPLLFFLYSRAACSALAEAVSDMDFLPNRQAKQAAEEEFKRLAASFELDTTDSDTAALLRLAGKGIAYHHAGILPPLKEVIERMFCAGHVRLLCCTETFALGVNMPARSVAFEGIRKWNGVARVPLKTREYQQMAGRAGRRGIDSKGSVYLTFDPFSDDPDLVTSMVKGKVEPVESQFNLSYGTLLNLYARLGDGIYTACERSFSNFKALRSAEKPDRTEKRRRGKREHERKRERKGSSESGRWREGRHGRNHGKGRRGRRDRKEPQAPKPVAGPQRFKNVVQQVRIKLGILAELGCLDSDNQVTDQGRFAMQVFGHEMVVTELVWSGVLERISPTQIAVLAAAIVHESRPNVFYGGPSPKKVMGKDALKLANRVVGRLTELEEDRGVRQPSKLLDWSLSGTVSAWADGVDFTDLREYSDASDGDVVRVLRQAIQVLRLCVSPLRAMDRHSEAGKVKAAKDLLKRGLVDAEWQLRRAGDAEDDEEAAEELADEERDETVEVKALPAETVEVKALPDTAELDADAAFSEGLIDEEREETVEVNALPAETVEVEALPEGPGKAELDADAAFSEGLL